MSNYYPPAFMSEAFNCPVCDVYSDQSWCNTTYTVKNGTVSLDDVDVAICGHCGDYSLWYDEKMIVPDQGMVTFPNSDLPKEIIEDYNEARSILSKSPRGAAALSRLAIQKLCKHLGESGDNINDDIKHLVQKGLPVKVQQALDIVRVVGNNAVHPGQIDLKDNQKLAVTLFGLINLIADVMITQPKHINSIYESLPENHRKGIENRDKKIKR